MQKLKILLVIMAYLVTQGVQASAFILHDEKGCSAVFAAGENDKKDSEEEEAEPECD